MEIGEGTTIREYSTINRGTAQSFKTTVGKQCFIMSYVHLAHDCHIGDGVILGNSVQLAGHVTDRRQSHRVGSVGGAPVRADRPVQLHRRVFAHIQGRSSVCEGERQSDSALRPEQGRSAAQRRIRGRARELKRAYRLFFNSELNLSQARERAEEELQRFPEVEEFLRFVDRSDRGLVI